MRVYNAALCRYTAVLIVFVDINVSLYGTEHILYDIHVQYNIILTSSQRLMLSFIARHSGRTGRRKADFITGTAEARGFLRIIYPVIVITTRPKRGVTIWVFCRAFRLFFWFYVDILLIINIINNTISRC